MLLHSKILKSVMEGENVCKALNYPLFKNLTFVRSLHDTLYYYQNISISLSADQIYL